MTGSRGATATIVRHGYGKKVRKTEFAQQCQVSITTDESENYNGCQRELLIKSDYQMEDFEVTVINNGVAISMAMNFQDLQMLAFSGQFSKSRG